MNEELKQKLLQAGISEAAIAILVEQELTTEESLKGFTYDRLVALGIKAGSAKILADMYGPKEGRRWPSRRKKLSDMGPEDLIREVARDPLDRELVRVAQEKLGDLGIFATQPDGSIAVDVTLDAYRHHKEVPSIPERVRGFVMKSLQDLRGEKQWANPFASGPLSWFDPFAEIVERDEETFAAVWYMKIYQPNVFEQLGKETIWEQCTRKPDQGAHIISAKLALRSTPEQRISVEQRMRWTGPERRKGGDCGDPPARR